MSVRAREFDQIEQLELLRLLQLQHDLLGIVAYPKPLSERLDTVCSAFEGAVSGMVATVMRLDDKGRLNFVCAPSVPRDILDHLDHVIPAADAGSCAHAAWSGMPTYVDDAGTDLRWGSMHDIANAHGIRACWSAPVRDSDQQVIGTFALTAFDSRLPDTFHRLLLHLGATVVGLLFDQDRNARERGARGKALRRLALAADATPNGVLFTDSAGRIEWMNAGMHALCGLSMHEMEGKRIGDILLAPRTDPARIEALQRAIEQGVSFTDTLLLVDKQGQPFTSHVSCTPRLDDMGHCEGAVAMFVDVTAIKRLSEFNALLARVSDAIAHEEDADALMQTICDLAVRHAGLRLAWIGCPDPQTGWFNVLAASGPATQYLHEVRISGDPAIAEGRGPCGVTWRSGHSSYHRSFSNVESLQPWVMFAEKHGFKAVASLAIRRNEAMWAVLSVYHEQLDSFDDALKDVLETLAANISRGLDRIDLIHREREVQALNQSMLDSATLGVTLTRNRIILRANQRAAEILGTASPSDLMDLDAGTLYATAAVSKAAAARIRDAFSEKRHAILEAPVRRLDGEIIWLRLEGAPFEHDGFDEIWTLIDVTEQHQAVENQALLANALAAVQEGVIIADAGQDIVYVNPAFETLTGYNLSQVRGRNCRFLQGADTDPGTTAEMRQCIRSGRPFTGEVLNYTRDGQSFWNLLTINPLRNDVGELTHFVGVQRDVTDVRNLNERLAHLAFHDELTGLPNRRDLDRYLTRALESAPTAAKLAVAIIDLDDFKAINDSLGHEYGDVLLINVTQRLQARLHEGDFIARLGGDEFVVVFTDLPELEDGDAISQRILALGESFSTPFEIKHGHAVEIGMSMGVALAPEHATEGGALLRLADEALFQAKQNKFERPQWWAVYGAHDLASPAPEQVLEPYGESASELLGNVKKPLLDVLDAFVDAFYRELRGDNYGVVVLESLSEDELTLLRQHQVEHLTLLTAPDTRRESLMESGIRVGRIHALAGIDSLFLMRWMAIYLDLLSSYFNAMSMSARHRYRLVQVVEHRLQDDMQAQLQAHEDLHNEYARSLEHPIPERSTSWNEAMMVECDRMADLAGIRCTLLMRQSAQDTYSIEIASGSAAQAVIQAFEQQFGRGTADTISPPEDTTLILAWQAATIQTVASLNAFHGDDAKAHMATALRAQGIRSIAYIPILDERRLPVALIVIMGGYPNQFSGKEMQYFTRGLQQRWSEIWLRITRPSSPVSQQLAIEYRRRLFKGGLRMLLQPVVDLNSGRPIKVEALARLVLEDGTLVPPDVFVPLLRQAELDALFRQGLDLSLRSLRAMDTAGLAIDIALNVAPQTLIDPECDTWIQGALAEHQVDASRLTLEILETQRVDVHARDEGVRRLTNLGIRFAIDDLGSGYSSLRRLASLPFESIKVDQDLLARLYMDPVQTISLVSAVIQIGRDFGCKVIVEGLEDEAKIEVARLLGAHYGQGFAIARPMTTEALIAWAGSHHLRGHGASLGTPLGALAFQWISLRHQSLHTSALEACPLTPMIDGDAQQADVARALHARVHADPDDTLAARQLLEWLEQYVRNRRL